MAQFLIAALGAVAILLALILAAQFGGPPVLDGKRPRRVASAVAGVALVAAVAIAAYAGFATVKWQQAEAQRRSLDAHNRSLAAQFKTQAAQQHRAWVYATPALDGPMIIKDRAISLMARYRAENKGDAPAADIAIASVVIPRVDVDIRAVQKSLCDGLRVGDNVTASIRDSLFPSEKAEISRVEGVSPDLVDGQVTQQGATRLEFWWVGCVGYHSVGDKARHRSGFIYQIAESGAGPRGIVPISLADQIIPKARLVVLPYAGGGVAAD
ncbi:MAG TPA: hypothetical protein VKQ73_17460 [Stellaceae bacterium]|nr:hypothetical protein [Stellaceae bacterium]